MIHNHSGQGRRFAATVLASCLFALAGLVVADPGASAVKPSKASPPSWKTTRIELPVSDAVFPAGVDSEIANSQCLICHSAGMVLRQPPLTKDQWHAEIVKMRTAFGALIPEDQVDALTEYLFRINRR